MILTLLHTPLIPDARQIVTVASGKLTSSPSPSHHLDFFGRKPIREERRKGEKEEINPSETFR